MTGATTVRPLAASALAAVCLAVASAPLVAGTANAAPDRRLTDAQARTALRNAGYAIWSPGNCSDPRNRNCTSFQNIWKHTVDSAVGLRGNSKCAGMTVTGGTEAGHPGSGRGSHADGWALNMNLNSCLESYVRKNFKLVGQGAWGIRWKAPSGNVYTKVKSGGTFTNWDIVFYS